MNVIILGSNGMLGSMLAFIGKTIYKQHTIIPIGRTEYDILIDPIENIQKLFEKNCCIINCIGAIPQKKYTQDEYDRINTTFPQDLSQLCLHNSVPLIHISTNCVFSGVKSNYIESDVPDAEDVYGKSKALGEPAYGLTIRCSIIGPEKSTHAGLLEWFLQCSDSSVNGYIDSYWNGLTTLELSHIIFDIINIGIMSDVGTLLLKYYYF